MLTGSKYLSILKNQLSELSFHSLFSGYPSNTVKHHTSKLPFTYFEHSPPSDDLINHLNQYTIRGKNSSNPRLRRIEHRYSMAVDEVGLITDCFGRHVIYSKLRTHLNFNPTHI